MHKILRGVFIALGLSLFGASFYLYNNFTNQPETVLVADGNYDLKNSDDSSGSSKMVMVKGKIAPKAPVVDSATGVKANYPLLQRKVEVYQYFLDGDKPMMGWKDYPVKNFKAPNGREFKNPPFYKALDNRNFYGNITVNGGNLPIDYRFLSKDLDQKKYQKSFYVLNNLPESGTPKDFTYKKNHYLKEGPNPKSRIGSVRIYYKALNYRELPELTIIGQQTKGILSRSNSDCRFYDTPVEMQDIAKTYNQDAIHAALGAAFFGAFFILLGLFKGRA